MSYLEDFLFTRERARAPINALSGGERNRLLLARLFTQPANLLILDEPTNDLDLETLEVLEDLLLEYDGTLLLVSHDRAFLNNIVTSTLALGENGNVDEYVGGYDDWHKQIEQAPVSRPTPSPASVIQTESKADARRRTAPAHSQDGVAGLLSAGRSCHHTSRRTSAGFTRRVVPPVSALGRIGIVVFPGRKIILVILNDRGRSHKGEFPRSAFIHQRGHLKWGQQNFKFL
jgi:energy-coupling factor transporter ATP-binding protein EcfA2